MTPSLDPTMVVLGIGFGSLALAVVAWIAIILNELPDGAPGLNRLVTSITSFIFDATPAQADVNKSSLLVRLFAQRLIPIILWLLIIVPMVIFPIIFVIMPLLHIPWTVLLPPTP